MADWELFIFLKLLSKMTSQSHCSILNKFGNNRDLGTLRVLEQVILDDSLWCIVIGRKLLNVFLPNPPLHYNYNRDTMNFILS